MNRGASSAEGGRRRGGESARTAREKFVPLMLGVGGLVGLLVLLQLAAIIWVFGSRLAFGRHFDPVIFSEFETVRSTESVDDTIGLRRAEEARREARQPIFDDVTRAMERAERERAQARSREEKASVLQSEAEKEAEILAQRGEALLGSGLRRPAIEAFESAVRRAPGLLSAVRRLSSLYEEQGQFSLAYFLWEKAGAGAGSPGPAATEIQSHLKRLAELDETTRKAGEKPLITSPRLRPPDVGSEAAPPARLRIARIVRTDLPLEGLYDLRFRLEFSLDSEGFLGPIEISGVLLEVAFYDQTRGSDGRWRPVRVEAPGLPFKLQPRREWIAGERQTLSLNYSVPHGYFRSKAMRTRSPYAYGGVMVTLSFRGVAQDRLAEPPSLFGEATKK